MNRMEMVNLAGIDRPVSRLTFGTTGASAMGKKEEAFKIFDAAFERGFRTYDTAHSYGAAEETLGAWINDRGLRNQVVILTKGLNPNQHYTTSEGENDWADTLRRQMEESLVKLGTDHVELFLMHRDDPAKPVGEIVEVLNELKKEGKVCRFGGSNWTLERTLAANAYAKEHGLDGFTAVGPSFSLAYDVRDPWGGSITLCGPAQAAFREWLTQSGTPLFCYSSLGRGFFSGRYRTDGDKPMTECLGEGTIAEYDMPENVARLTRAEHLAAKKNTSVSAVALAYILAQDFTSFPLVSPSNPLHQDQNIDALALELSADEISYLEKG